MGSDVADVQLLKALAKSAQQPRHPAHEGLAVVAHHLEGLAADLEALIHPLQDRRQFGVQVQAEADQVPAMVRESQLITAVAVVAGSAKDQAGSLELIQQSEAATGLAVETALGDCAYGSAENRIEFARRASSCSPKSLGPTVASTSAKTSSSSIWMP